jgi:hypothetical protein
MPGAIVAVLLCVWYYQTATKMNLNPLPWIFALLLVYYGVKYGWTYGFVKPVFGVRTISPMLKDISGAAVGTLAAVIFRSQVLLKQPPGATPEQ